MEYEPENKPDPKACPRQFCFFWQMATIISVKQAQPASVAKGCHCPFGRCIRLNPEQGTSDYYEDHGPNLRKAGLPWFYFYPSPPSRVSERQKKYITESEVLWGKEHWRKPL